MSGAVYQEDPYQHIVRIEIELGRIWVIAQRANAAGETSISGMGFPYQHGVTIGGILEDAVGAVLSVAVPDTSGDDVTSESLAITLGREEFDGVVGTLEERMAAAVAADFTAPAGDDVITFWAFSTNGVTSYTGPIAVFDEFGRLSTITGYNQDGVLTTVTLDPPR